MLGGWRVGAPRSFFSDRDSRLAGQDLLVEAARLGHGFDLEFLGQDARAVVILSHRRVEMADTNEICHERPMDAFPAWAVDQDRAAHRYCFSATATRGVAFRHAGHHLQVNLMQPVALLGTPVGVDVLLHVVAPVETPRFAVAMERVFPLLLALLGGAIGDAAIESLYIDPHRLPSQEVGPVDRRSSRPRSARGEAHI